MIYRKSKLARQLLWLVGIAFMVLFLSLGVVLPKILVPVLETNIYRYLSEPLKVIDNDFDKILPLMDEILNNILILKLLTSTY